MKKLKIWCIFLFGILAFCLTGYASSDSWVDNFDGTELSSNWQLALKGATSGNVFANVANGYVETGLSGGWDWWDSGGIATAYPISSSETISIKVNKAGQAMSCYNYFHGGYIPCGFEFYLFSKPWAHWGYRTYSSEPYNPSTGWPLDNYGFGILASYATGLQIAKGIGDGNVIVLYDIPSQYWAADGVWEILKDGSNFSLWYNGTLIGDVYNIPEIANKDLYFIADARRYAGWETVYVKLDSVEIYEAEAIIPATIDIDPDTLNLKSNGKWVTAYIELPEGYNVNDIDVSTILLEDVISAELQPTEVGDHDNDEIADLMVKFDRSDVQAILEPADEVELTVTGELTDGIPFKGSNTIQVIKKGKK